MSMTENILRFLSAVTVTTAAILLTLSWRRWSHSLVRPAARYAALVMWTVTAYRWAIYLSFVESGGELGTLIRLMVNVMFIAMGSAFIVYALTTYEYHKAKLTIVGNEHDR